MPIPPPGDHNEVRVLGDQAGYDADMLRRLDELEGKLDQILGHLDDMRSSGVAERLAAWAGNFLLVMCKRLTAPETAKYMAWVVIAIGAMLFGANVTGFGFSLISEGILSKFWR